MKEKEIDIKTLREKKNISLEELAYRSGVCRRTIENWENKKTKPKKLMLRALRELLR